MRRLLAVVPLVAIVAGGCDAEPPSGAAERAMPPAEGTAAAAAIGSPSVLSSPVGAGSGQPHLAVAPDGVVVMSWLEPGANDDYALKFSRLESGGWSEPTVVASGDDFFVNWADFPSVEPITSETWIAHWLKRAPDSFGSYDVAIALSQDAGTTWSSGTLLNDDGFLTEHGFVSMFSWDGAIGAVWLDGRRIAEQFESGEFDPEAPPVGMSLRYARIDYNGDIVQRGELDELACDCCQTDAALTESGPLVVYRDRTEDEIRDNVVVRWLDGEWQSGVTLGPDNWRIEGCPVNGPAIASSGADAVAAWFTAAGNLPQTRLARSTDGGATFGAPVDIDGRGAFGHVDVVLLEDGAAVVSWWRRGDDGIALMARAVEPDGTPGEPRLIATSATSQPLDVPQMVAAQGKLVFAWTDASDMTVRTATAPVGR